MNDNNNEQNQPASASINSGINKKIVKWHEDKSTQEIIGLIGVEMAGATSVEEKMLWRRHRAYEYMACSEPKKANEDFGVYLSELGSAQDTPSTPEEEKHIVIIKKQMIRNYVKAYNFDQALKLCDEIEPENVKKNHQTAPENSLKQFVCQAKINGKDRIRD